MNRPWTENYPEYMDWNAKLPSQPIFTLLDEAAKKFPEKKAFYFEGKTWTWREIDDLSRRMAKGFQNKGVSKGKKVGLFLPNSPYSLIAYYAIARTGATIVNYSPLYETDQLAHQIEDSETDIMVTLDMKILYDKVEPLLKTSRLNQMVVCPMEGALPFPKNKLFKLLKGSELASVPNDDRHLSFDSMVDNKGDIEEVEIDPEEDVAVLQYTGGTTGVPKGAMLTHQNIYANTLQTAICLPDRIKDIEDIKMVAVIPFFHVFAMTVAMNTAVHLGAQIIATPRFEEKKTLHLIDKLEPTLFPGVPAMYNKLNHYKGEKTLYRLFGKLVSKVEDACNVDLKSKPIISSIYNRKSRFRTVSDYNLRSLEACISGGAPLPVEIKQNFEKRTGCVVVEGYGLTESSPVLTVNPIDGENKPGSIGQPLVATDIELREAETEKPVAQGERGELWAKGPQIMKGYYNQPEETAHVLKDGWLRTGDIAVMDEQGYFKIVDRIKDMIIINGFKVFPGDVEKVTYQLDAVEECIVAGIPGRGGNDVVKMWVKPKDGESVSESDLREFLTGKLAKVQIPSQIEIRDEPLPKTMIGKLSRKDLVEEEKAQQNDDGNSPSSPQP